MPILTDDEREGTTLASGKYALQRVIGRGGMATVFEALHTWTGRKVAVKVINASLTTDAEKAQRYLQEARTATALEHPNVVEVLDMGREESDGTVYIVFELLRGESLRDRLEREGKLGADEMATLLLPILDALAVAHRRGIVHRDLKPDNIFLQDDGYGSARPKLLDFGIAKMEQRGSQPTGPVSGTVEYLSPERAQGHPTDPTTDVWSMGVVMFECLTGSVPFTSDTLTATLLAIVQQPVPLIRTLAPVPEGIAEVVDRCLSRTQVNRYRDASQLRDAVLSAVGAAPPETIESIPPLSGLTVLPGFANPSLPPPEVGIVRATPIMLIRKRPLRRAIALAAALLSFVFLFVLWRGRQADEEASAGSASVGTPSSREVAASPSAIIEARPDTAVLPPAPEARASARGTTTNTLVSTRSETREAPETDEGASPRETSAMVARRPAQTVRAERGANGSLILD